MDKPNKVFAEQDLTNHSSLWRIIVYILITVGFLLVILFSYAFFQFLRLGYLSKDKDLNISELSAGERIDDFEYLTQFVRNVYSYNQVLVEYMA